MQVSTKNVHPVSVREISYLTYLRGPLQISKLRVERWLRKILRITRVTARTDVGVMRLDPNDVVQFAILLNGAYERETLKLFKSCVTAGTTAIDVGANVGQYALAASGLVGPSGRVLAFEPQPQTFEELRRNLAMNAASNVLPVLAALTSSDQLLHLVDPPAGNRGLGSVASTESYGSYCVPGMRLAPLLRTLGITSVSVIKIDVEGHEGEVLSGLFAEGDVRPANIILEFQPANINYSTRPENILHQLDREGYDLFTITGTPYTFGDPLPEHNLWAQHRSSRACSSAS